MNCVPSNNSIECKSQILWTYANEEFLYYFDFLKIGTELLAVASSDNFQLAFHLPEWRMQDGHILRDSWEHATNKPLVDLATVCQGYWRGEISEDRS